MVQEDQWGDLKCLHKACQAAITDGGLFTDTGVDERCGNERQGENDCEVKTVSRVKRPENRQELVQTRLRRKGFNKALCFFFVFMSFVSKIEHFIIIFIIGKGHRGHLVQSIVRL